MPKITITIEDQPDGAVIFSGTPSLPELQSRAKQPEPLSPAECYAIAAWIALHRAADQVARATSDTLAERLGNSKH